jgi:hypothetical protein
MWINSAAAIAMRTKNERNSEIGSQRRAADFAAEVAGATAASANQSQAIGSVTSVAAHGVGENEDQVFALRSK